MRNKIGGNLSEYATVEKFNRDQSDNRAANINDHIPNAALIDVASRNGLTSCKAYIWQKAENPRNAGYAQALKLVMAMDKRKARVRIGGEVGLRAIDVTAIQLRDLARSPDKKEQWGALCQHLPKSIVKTIGLGANRQTIAARLRKITNLAIPDDHIASFLQYLDRNPSRVVDSKAPKKEQIRQLVDAKARVRGMGISSTELYWEIRLLNQIQASKFARANSTSMNRAVVLQKSRNSDHPAQSY